MKVKHNKKRNVGILFAQLTEYVSSALVEGDIKKAQRALRVLGKHFSPGSEIFREFRLFRALVMTEVPSSALATSIITEARAASKKLDKKKLMQEKSMLIKDINYNLEDSNFYDRRVPDYKAFATVQTLLTTWASNNPDIAVMAQFEKNLHEHLQTEKSAVDLNDFRTPDVNRLAVQIMQTKLEERYGQTFTNDQAKLLKEYVFSSHGGNDEKFQAKLSSIKKACTVRLLEFKRSCDNDILLEQVDAVREKIHILNEAQVDDATISQYLTLMKLTSELVSGDRNG
tara:strand:- start:2288 stop:3142 length:855 start_codon:yes stop_codon:yes gene_type:complete